MKAEQRHPREWRSDRCGPSQTLGRRPVMPSVRRHIKREIMKACATLLACVAVACSAACDLSRSYYVSTAQVLVQTQEGSHVTFENEAEKRLHAKFLKALPHGARGSIQYVSNGVWVLSATGRNPEDAQRACRQLVDVYLSADKNGIERVLLSSPTKGKSVGNF